MLEDYEFVLYRPEFRAQVLDLQTHLWNPDTKVNAAYLRWKYEENPLCETPLIFVALDRENVVGMRGVYGANWMVGNPPAPVPALCCGDLVVAPEHRGRLLFFPIMQAAIEELARRNYRYLFSMSGNAVTRALSLLDGFQKVGEYSMLRRDGEPGVEAPPGFASLDPSPRPQAMAGLVQSIGFDGRIRHVRDRTWFAWRYRNPLSEYRFLYAQTSGRLDGYLVLQYSSKRPSEGLRIMDWEATDAGVREALLREALASAGTAPLSTWLATLPGDVIRLLENHRFVPYARSDGHRPGPLVKAVPGVDVTERIAGRNLLNLSDWDLRMSYSDSY